MKRAHTYLLAGLTICVVAIVLVIYKIEGDRKNRDVSSTIVNDEGTSSAERSQGLDGGMPRSAHRQRAARENIGVLSPLGYVLTADDIGDHTAKGNVQIITPEGDILRSDSMSISPDGDNIFLQGHILVESTSGGQVFTRAFVDMESSSNVDTFASLALDGSSQSFIGTEVYLPGSIFQKRPSPKKKK